MRLFPMYVSTTCTVNEIGVATGNTITTAGNVRSGIYTDNNGVPGSLVVDSGSIAYSVAATFYSAVVSATLSPGWYWIGSVIQTGSASFTGYTYTLPSFNFPILQMASLSQAVFLPYAYGQSGITGALPSSWGSTAMAGANGLYTYYKVA